ncbi:hypothetical protein TIFTF001_006026 [Ficus carica]|uniref:Uncharacterized protein n=1 Tax=Ficus carica TaxID=3494 RepID=A0AA87ZLY8_FICCA|nr:hypothetical protein TIFTF001_006026 [Ficus carica]
MIQTGSDHFTSSPASTTWRASPVLTPPPPVPPTASQLFPARQTSVVNGE